MPFTVSQPLWVVTSRTFKQLVIPGDGCGPPFVIFAVKSQVVLNTVPTVGRTSTVGIESSAVAADASISVARKAVRRTRPRPIEANVTDASFPFKIARSQSIDRQRRPAPMSSP